MKRIIFTYGVIAGAVIIANVMLSFAVGDGEGGTGLSVWLGYLVMIVALSVIFLGIKRYRDRELGGVIRFGRAFVLGLGITLVASAIYVASWEVYLSMTDHAFIHDYTESILAARRAEGLVGAALEAEIASMKALEVQYANPLYRLPMTFLEIFPVGLLITLVSAGLLRNERFAPSPASVRP